MVFGLAWLEITQETPEGVVISVPVALLITDNPDIAQEICQGLQSMSLARAEPILKVRTTYISYCYLCFILCGGVYLRLSDHLCQP
jgi:hypothetical protein